MPLRIYRPHLSELRAPLLERVIGVVYRPEAELVSHYFRADVLHQFDALFHYDTTRALGPLERNAVWISGEVSEGYPSPI